MGIARPFAYFLSRRAHDLRFGGQILTLGRQEAQFDLATAIHLAADGGHLPRDGATISLPGDHFLLDMIADGSAFCSYGSQAGRGLVSDVALFRLLGFERVASLDFSDFEGAEYIADLNLPNATVGIMDKFDVILNGGTLEHIFHVPNALTNIHHLLKIGGYIVHEIPTNNCVDHGFYQVSPTLFHDYYAANGYEICSLYLVRRFGDASAGPVMWSEYHPGSLDAISYGGLDDAVYHTVVIARRTAASRCDVIPQQGAYRAAWNVSRGKA